jgi:LysM repeat protein
VKPGETLDSIAKMHGTSSATLLRLNNHQLGSNGAALQPGMRLEI